MQPFSYHRQVAVSARISDVRNWIERYDDECQMVIHVARKENRSSCLCFSLGLVSVFGLVGTWLWMINLPPRRNWPVIGWIFLGVLVLSCGIPWLEWEARYKTNARLLCEKTREMDLKRRLDPLYQRGRLLLQAADNFSAHCAIYEAWYKAVNDGLQEADEERGSRYHDFLSRASEVLERACVNFTNAAEIERRQKQLERAHPNVGKDPQSTALSEILARLDQPVNIPAAALRSPEEILAFEEALHEVAAEPLPKDQVRK